MTDREYPARPIVGIGIVVIKDDQVLLCQTEQTTEPRQLDASRRRPGARRDLRAGGPA